jgi:hypothetical protein
MPARGCKKNAQLGLCDNWLEIQLKIISETTVNHCGSWLASDGVCTFNIDVGFQIAIAGKPAPTGFCGV